MITPEYFRVLQTPLLKGRFFNDADTADSLRVVIINEALARKYFPKADALGKRMTFDNPRKDPKWVTIVGIVGSIKHRGLDIDPQPEYYVPQAQFPVRSMVLAVRSGQDSRTLTSAWSFGSRMAGAKFGCSATRPKAEYGRWAWGLSATFRWRRLGTVRERHAGFGALTLTR